jgi:hypothetical protein
MRRARRPINLAEPWPAWSSMTDPYPADHQCREWPQRWPCFDCIGCERLFNIRGLYGEGVLFFHTSNQALINHCVS